MHKKLAIAHKKGEKVPELVSRLSKEHDDRRPNPEWSKNWEDTQVPVERVIAYWSRVLAPAETRYSATEREALAAKESLVRFQPFVEGERILLVTDHSALTWAKTYENVNRRLAAWGLVLAAFPEMVIIHRPGRIHSNVDPLSRLPRIPNFVSPARDDLPEPSLSTEHEELQKVWNEFIRNRELVMESQLVGIKESKKGDSTSETHLHVYINEEMVKRFVEGYLGDKDFAKALERTRTENFDERKYQAYRVAHNGLLYFEDADNQLRLCVPKTERSAIVKAEAHKSTHAGWERTLTSAWERFYWPQMSSDIKEYVSSCDPCQKTKHNRGAAAGYLQPLEIPTKPFEDISLDLITGLPKANGRDAVLVVVDKLTKYAQFIATTNDVNALQTAELLFKHVVKYFRLPTRIIGDRDPRWTSQVWSSLARLFDTKLALSTSKHPQTDGQTEVMNQTLETMLRAYIQADQRDWANWLDILQFAYNNATHSSHNQVPAKLLLGYKPRSPLDFLAASGLETSKGQPDLRRRMVELASRRNAARDAIKRSADRQAYQFDKGRRAPDLVVGDEVLINPHSLEWVNESGRSRKLMQRKVGPFEITKVISPTAYRLRMPDTYKGHNVLNLQHLTKYHRSPDEFRLRLANPRDALPSSEEYEVEKIVGERRKNGKLYYRIRWKGYDAEDDSWQTARDVRNAPELLKAWRNRL